MPRPRRRGVADRRRTHRTRLEIPVDYSTVDSFFEEFSANINEGGMFIETESPAEPDTVVQMSFRLPGTADPLKVEGRVAWVSDGTRGRPRGMGIEFHALPPEARDTINRVVRMLRVGAS
jgi:uncharacterized protein (TIGR02266 family)